MKKIKTGMRFTFRDMTVRVCEYNVWQGNWWVLALTTGYGYKKGDEFTLTERTIKKYLDK